MTDLNKFFFEANDPDINDEIEPIVNALEKKGYQIKYASPGYQNTKFANDRDKDHVVNGKFTSTARIVFSRDYKFDNTPEGWEWKTLDNGAKALYVKPYTYNKDKGTEADEYRNWRGRYMTALKKWVSEIQKVGDETPAEKDENFSAS